jgi:SNF2 family DNA or RNA helicase
MIVHKQSNSLILKLRDPSTVTNVVPRARVVKYKGVDLTQVHFGLDEVRVLRNLGINAPSPVKYNYKWEGKYTPFTHQVTTTEFLTLNPRAICLNDMGTGKSLSALWAADYLMQKNVRRKAIIVSPMSTMDSVWANEIRMHFMFTRTCAVLHGTRERRLKLLALDVDFYIINHDGLKVIGDEIAKRNDIDLWILDEAAVYRNSQTSRFKSMVKLLRPTDWVWLMTGTPCPVAPTDAWALAKLMGSTKAPKYFNTFKHATMEQITQYKWVPRPGAFDQAYAILQPGIRFKKSDCLDLPPVTMQYRHCDLTPSQHKTYKDMHQELVASVQGKEITAANAAVKLSKLLQICCGVLYDGNGGHALVDAKNRLELVEEICEEAANKVIIFVPFTAALNMVADHLRQRWTVEVVDGSTSPTERKRIFDAFQQSPDPRILVAHPKTTAHGLTLTQADTTIWYAPIFSLEIFEQANNRMDRPGQRNPMTVVMLESTGMESSIYAALRSKGRMQDSVLELYKKEVGLT